MTGKPKGKDWTLTAEAFEKLLDCLDADRDTAGEKYEDLRRALVRYFEGRRISFAEERVDEVFNRVSRKLTDGVQINNFYAYCYEVARRVHLERRRAPESRMDSIEEFDLEYSAPNTLDDEIEKEKMLKYLSLCLEKLPPESSVFQKPGTPRSRRNKIAKNVRRIRLRPVMVRGVMGDRMLGCSTPYECCLTKPITVRDWRGFWI